MAVALCVDGPSYNHHREEPRERGKEADQKKIQEAVRCPIFHFLRLCDLCNNKFDYRTRGDGRLLISSILTHMDRDRPSFHRLGNKEAPN